MALDGGPGGKPADGSATQTSTSTTAGQGTEGQQQSSQSGETPGGEGGTQDGAAGDTEALRGALKKERDARRVLESRVRELETKDLPDAQKAATRAQQLEEENKSLAEQLVRERTTNAVTRVAANLGVIDVDVAMLLLEQADTIDYDDEGKPINAEAALKALIAKRPYLVRSGQQSADAAAGTRAGAKPGGGMNDLIRRAAGREGQ